MRPPYLERRTKPVDNTSPNLGEASLMVNVVRSDQRKMYLTRLPPLGAEGLDEALLGTNEKLTGRR